MKTTLNGKKFETGLKILLILGSFKRGTNDELCPKISPVKQNKLH